ncbi:MAG: spore coat protein CotJB [Eubacteriales bacterium]|nr:spore coat protein CotJB [Eubacteriales bacterium]
MMYCDNELLRKVYETGFALDDAALYLDTHPTDREAMKYYQCVQQANRDAVQAYERVHGPLMINRVESEDWSWNDAPWPWEGGMR